jgi:hypothetical protein
VSPLRERRMDLPYFPRNAGVIGELTVRHHECLRPGGNDAATDVTQRGSLRGAHLRGRGRFTSFLASTCVASTRAWAVRPRATRVAARGVRCALPLLRTRPAVRDVTGALMRRATPGPALRRGRGRGRPFAQCAARER